MSDLYIMQASTGMVKIGRSVEVEKRRRAIEAACGMGVSVIHVLQGQGDLEGLWHYALAKHRGLGEWYPLTPEFREALHQLVQCRLRFVEPVLMADCPFPGRSPNRKAPRTVRYVKKDGTKVSYGYGPWAPNLQNRTRTKALTERPIKSIA